MSDATRLFDAAPAPALTADERARLSGGVDWSAGEHAGRKALRIIDAHAADRAALVARVAELERQCDEHVQGWTQMNERRAAANALLGRIPVCLLTDCPVYADLMAHLSAQRDSK